MLGPVHIRGAIFIPPGELRWRFARSSGPGGQHVNKTETAAELSFDLAASRSLPPFLQERALRALAGRLVDGVLTVRAEAHRSQFRNRQDAAQRLGEILREATAPPPRPRRPTKPSRGARERRLREKKQRGERKRSRSWRPDD